MPNMPKTFTSLWLATALALPCLSHADSHYTLEKVVEVSRHGIRPPSPDNRKAIETGSARVWAGWQTPDGELTGHGYTAAWLKGQYESQRYQQLGLLEKGCPGREEFYVRASPLQRTRATAQALTDAAFPGCGVIVHAEQDRDPLFQHAGGPISEEASRLTRQQIHRALGGTLDDVQRRLQPQVQALKQAVCQPGQPCPVFDLPWQLVVWSDGSHGIKGLDTLAAMAETIRLEYSENKPLAQVAFGHVHSAEDVARLLPLLSAKYDYTNDLPGPARRGASLLMDQIAKALQQGVAPTTNAPPDVRWLLYVAHDINISGLRTLLGFHWQQEGYPAGNIPPGGSLVFERWRDEKQQRFIRIYFQSQSLDQLRQLTPIAGHAPLLLSEFSFSGCKMTPVGTLCPYGISLQHIENNIDRSLIVPVHYPSP